MTLRGQCLGQFVGAALGGGENHRLVERVVLQQVREHRMLVRMVIRLMHLLGDGRMLFLVVGELDARGF